MPVWVTNNLEGIFSAAAVGVIGAVIAGVSAWLKTWFVNRDDKTRAAQQLELASKRTEFAVQWLAAKRTIAEDETNPEDVKARAQRELDAAYDNAQSGFADGRIAIEDASYEQVVDQLKAILLLRSGLSTTSKWLVAFFYVCVFSVAAVLGVQENVACDFPTAEVPLSDQAPDTASGGGGTGNQSEDQESGSTAVPAPATLDVVVDGPARVVSGREATYTIRVSNTGVESPAIDVTGRFGNPANVKELESDDSAESTTTTPPDATESTSSTRPEYDAGVFEWPTTEVPASGSIAFSVTVVVVADPGTEIEYLAEANPATDESAAAPGTPPESATATATARTNVIAPCVQYRFVDSGWAWFFGAVAGTAVLRLLFGWLVARNEGRRRRGPEDVHRSDPGIGGA